MVKNKKHKPPSRIRYEESHPIVSCRVSRSAYNRIEAIKRADGKSNTDIMMLGVELAEPQVKKVEQLKKRSWDEGYKKGYADAKARYRVIYHCSVCGQAMEVASKEEKAAINEYMRERGWSHTECLERR